MHYLNPVLHFVILWCIVADAIFINETSGLTNETSVASATSFSDNTLNSMFRAAKYAALSYCTKNDLIILGDLRNACPCTLCTDAKEGTRVKKIYRGNVSSVIFQDDNSKEIILALKGTTSNNEWLMDFNIIPIPYHSLSQRKKGWKKYFKYNKHCKGCTVHKGFYDASKEIYDNIFAELMELSDRYPDYKLIITGHSLGGALAPFIANECLLLGKFPTVVTFGSPKIGNTFFASWMDKLWNTHNNYFNIDSSYHSTATPSYFRVSHKGDYVPLLPTRQMAYKHCGIDVYFDQNGLPFQASRVKLKKSPANVMNAEESGQVKYSTSEIDNMKESHRLYFLKMNQCNKNDL